MDALIRMGVEYGVLLVFTTVLLEQLGVPLPAYPVLLFMGSQAAQGELSLPALGMAALLAAVLADSLWYFAGRRFGRRVLGWLCRISLSPDSCVRQTELIFSRWGAPSLLVAKFVPGFSSVATVLAGATGIRRGPFLFFDALGALILDVRVPGGSPEGRIPGALLFGSDRDWPLALREHPRDSLIVVYCSCPNDASAVVVARKLFERGFGKVRPLAGDMNAWLAAGRELTP